MILLTTNDDGIQVTEVQLTVQNQDDCDFILAMINTFSEGGRLSAWPEGGSQPVTLHLDPVVSHDEVEMD